MIEVFDPGTKEWEEARADYYDDPDGDWDNHYNLVKSWVEQVTVGDLMRKRIPEFTVLPEAKFVGGCLIVPDSDEAGGSWTLVFALEEVGGIVVDEAQRQQLDKVCAWLADDSQPVPSWRLASDTLTITIPVWL